MPAALSSRTYFAAVFGCLLGAALCLGLALPYYQENRQDLPVDPARIVLRGDQDAIPTPTARGPDRLRRSPLLAVSQRDVTLNNRRLDSLEVMAEQLEVLKHNYQLIHPAEEGFPGVLLLYVAKDVSWSKLLPLLQTAAAAGYHTVLLVFAHTETIQRPILGAVRLDKSSDAQIELTTHQGGRHDGQTLDLDTEELSTKRDPDGATAVFFALSERTAYHKLARAAAAARNKGMKVIVPLPAETPRGDNAAKTP